MFLRNGTWLGTELAVDAEVLSIDNSFRKLGEEVTARRNRLEHILSRLRVRSQGKVRLKFSRDSITQRKGPGIAEASLHGLRRLLHMNKQSSSQALG